MERHEARWGRRGCCPDPDLVRKGGAEPWSGPCKLKTIFSFCKSALASAQPPVAALAKLAEISARRCGLARGLVPRSHVVAGLPAACCQLTVTIMLMMMMLTLITVILPTAMATATVTATAIAARHLHRSTEATKFVA